MLRTVRRRKKRHLASALSSAKNIFDSHGLALSESSVREEGLREL